ncbi:MAG: hypothetical protein C0598_09355 [Marinilabiliales bacterium]|nr:MAG: hypothetical protein C0598_09355 [Marinilabiliales bacterium]
MILKMKHIKLLAVIAAIIMIGFTSCKKDDDPKPAPTMSSVSVTGENIAFDITVTFSEAVYKNNDKTANLDDSSFDLSIAGGSEISNYSVSHSAGENSAVISIELSSNSTGDETVTITPASSTSIYNADGVAMETTQNKSINLGGNTNEFITKTGFIETDETWTANNIYLLDKKVVVSEGITLTIEAGTIVKGMPGEETLASALVVARGGKLMAEGTADNPIIFTAQADNITFGEKFGTNLTKEDNRLWGGLIILGSAPISAENGDTETNIEGIPTEDGYGLFGGDKADDNSGVISYISIRHGGISIGEGNEINGLTLGGVGNGTSISNVEVYATLDDGMECFGGTVNVENLLVYYQGDDGVDLDMNYSGTISNFAVIHGDGIGTDEALEIDGPEGTTNTDGLFTLSNGTLINEGTEPSAADFKSDAQGYVNNCTWINYPTSKPVKFRTKFVDPGVDCSMKEDAYLHLVSDPATLVFTDCSLEAVKVYDGGDSGTCLDELEAANQNAQAKVQLDGTGSTLDIATTFSWTYAANRDQL